MAHIAGRVGRLYVSDNGGSSFTLLGGVVDMSLGGSKAELDTTDHDSGIWREFINGRLDATLDATLNWDEADTGQEKVRDAFYSDSTLVIRFRMQEGSGSEENEATALVTSFGPSSPNDDVATVDVTFRLTGNFAESAQS